MTEFYKRYCELCAKVGKSASGVAAAIGMSNAAANGWKNGKKPSDITLEKLANYFGVSVEELTGEQKENPTVANGEVVDSVTQKIYDIVDSADSEKRKKILEILQVIDTMGG